MAYPGLKDRLFQNLPLFKNKIFELTTEKLNKSKELTINELLKEYLLLGSDGM